MKYAGIDLHNQSLTVCLLDHSRTVLDRRRFLCVDEPSIVRYFASLGPYRAVVEATTSYEWLVRLIEPSAKKVLLGLMTAILRSGEPYSATHVVGQADGGQTTSAPAVRPPSATRPLLRGENRKSTINGTGAATRSDGHS